MLNHKDAEDIKLAETAPENEEISTLREQTQSVTMSILSEIEKLPIEERRFIVQKALESIENSEFSPEEIAFLKILKGRFDENKHRFTCHSGKNWERIKEKLKTNKENLKALMKLEDLGGLPDLTKVEGDNFTFDDLVEKLPECRRKLSYEEVISLVEQIGGSAELMDEVRYESLCGKYIPLEEMTRISKFNIVTNYTWLRTRKEVLDNGLAITGAGRHGSYGSASAIQAIHKPTEKYENVGFRCTVTI